MRWTAGLGVVGGGTKVEVAVAGGGAEIGHYTLIDAMALMMIRVSCGGLPKHLGEAHHGHSARADDVGQHLSRSDGGQLVDILVAINNSAALSGVSNT